VTLFRAPFRLLPARARVRRYLRASFWLAPCFTNRPCDLSENKTRDASDRLLPPIRITCTRTSCVPGSCRDFHRADTPRSLGLHVIFRGTECFTTLENASADRCWARAAMNAPGFVHRLPTACVSSERGRCLPTAPAFPIEPLTPLSPLPRSAGCRSAFASPSAFALASVIAFPVGGSRQGRRDHHPVTGNGS